MNKQRLWWIALIAIDACAGADGSGVTGAGRPTAASIAIDQAKGFLGTIKLDVNEQLALTATVRDKSGAMLAEHAVAWTSSAPSVATVSIAGLVTPIAPGNTTISATSDGQSDTRAVQVIALDLTAFQLRVLVTDDGGNPVPDVSVDEVYYGARPPDCISCNIPFGNVVLGTTNAAGSYVGSFVADPEALDEFAGTAHAFAYVVTSQPNYETDRRFVVGTSTSFAQGIRLHPMRQITTDNDSLLVTIASTDPLYQQLDTTPAWTATAKCRSFRVVASRDEEGFSVSAAPLGQTFPAPYLEIDSPDESKALASGFGAVPLDVYRGEVIEVRVVVTMKPGDSPQSFVLHAR